jgi:hypothetical protein
MDKRVLHARRENNPVPNTKQNKTKKTKKTKTKKKSVGGKKIIIKNHHWKE